MAAISLAWWSFYVHCHNLVRFAYFASWFCLYNSFFLILFALLNSTNTLCAAEFKSHILSLVLQFLQAWTFCPQPPSQSLCLVFIVYVSLPLLVRGINTAFIFSFVPGRGIIYVLYDNNDSLCVNMLYYVFQMNDTTKDSAENKCLWAQCFIKYSYRCHGTFHKSGICTISKWTLKMLFCLVEQAKVFNHFITESKESEGQMYWRLEAVIWFEQLLPFHRTSHCPGKYYRKWALDWEHRFTIIGLMHSIGEIINQRLYCFWWQDIKLHS